MKNRWRVYINFRDLKGNNPVTVLSIHFNNDRDTYVDNISLSDESIAVLKEAGLKVNKIDNLSVDDITVNYEEDVYEEEDAK